MKFTIITATYNAEKTIESAIQSVASQIYNNIEYIIIDGNSKDNTLKKIEAQKNVVSKYISEPDSGIYEALNKGIKMATGDVIGFLHADDLFKSEDTIQHISELFKNSDIDGVYGDLEYVNIDDTNKVVRYWKSKPFKFSLLKSGWMPAHPTLFLKNKIYKEAGLFDISFKIAADYDFILRVFSNKTYRFAYLPKVITKMRLGGASNKNIKAIITKSKEDINALQKNKVGGIFTLVWKNVSKLPQFFKR